MTVSQPAKSIKPKVIAAIPCYNEERFIGEVVGKAKRYVDQVIVVDDGSRDSTSQAARAAGALVVSHEKNKGAGAATRSCFEAAKANHADIVVTLDGDNQHTPEEIPRLLTPILGGEADLVIGSRFLDSQSSVPRYRKFGIDVITWLFNIGSRVKISDAQSCFRAHSRGLLEALSITESGFGFSVEVIIKAREKGFTIQEVPISCTYHSKSSTLNPVSHGLGVALTVVKLRSKILLRRLMGGNSA
jgi:glycosyltransferase involved in cell wall biosynthesis